MAKKKNTKLTQQHKSELVAYCALRSWDTIAGRGKSMQMIDIQKAVFELCHGTNGKLSNFALLCAGETPYGELWDYNSEIEEHYILTRYFRNFEAVYLRGKDITQAILETKNFTSRELSTGRSLLDAARKALKFIKIALSFVNRYFNDSGKPKISGDNDVDIAISKILDDVWAHRHQADEEYPPPPKKAKTTKATATPPRSATATSKEGTATTPPHAATVTPPTAESSPEQSPNGLALLSKASTLLSDDARDDDDASSSDDSLDAQPSQDDDDGDAIATTTGNSDRPSNWVFPGFLTFLYCGPFADVPESRRIDFFNLKAKKAGKAEGGASVKDGRRAAKAEEMKAAAFERSREANRGMSVMEKVLVDMHGSFKKDVERSELSTLIMSLHMRAEGMRKDLKILEGRCERSGVWTEHDKMWDELQETQAEIKQLEGELKPKAKANDNNNNK